MTESRKSKLVSVIVITHEKYQSLLKTALKSLKAQSKTRFEIIVEENNDRTLAKACNDAIRRAKGDYIVRLDADDFIDGRLIEIESKYLDEHPEADAVWCDYWKTHPRKGQGFETHYLEFCPQTELEHACGAMFRRSAWSKLGGYDEGLRYQEAFDFWLRFHKAGFKSEHIAEPLYYYRQHPGSMSTNTAEKLKTRREIQERHNAL